MLKRLVFLFFLFPVFGFSQVDTRKAKQLFEQKKYPEAKKAYTELLSRNPSDPEILERLGDICAHSKSWKEAAQYYNRFIGLDPKNADAHYKYGGALSMQASSGGKLHALGLLGDMRSSFEKAISLQPKHIEARWALVEYYLQVPGIFGGSENKATRYADELSKLSAVDHYLAKGRIEEYFDRLPKAEKYYIKAHAIGNSGTTLKKLTSVYAKMKRPDKAKSVTDAYIKSTNPQSNASTKT